jgi:hypothetical protein
MPKLLTLLLLSTLMYGADKPKPTFTPDQKVEALKMQRRLLFAISQQSAANATVQIYNQAVLDYGKSICGDETKFKFNPDNIDCDAVPEVKKDEPKSNVPPPATPAPASKQ